jgi:toxin ParE1/3/4
MSDKVYTIKISKDAYDDLSDIQQYTLETFGEHQLLKYETLLNEALILIRSNPRIVNSRPDIPNQYLAWAVGEHIFIYRIEEAIIYLVRVLYSRMDFRFQFEE